ncbi:codeine O-demethylase-like [Rosa rugosa]|uniref:codeine O-demethylase-like n=1 Tax=Rosa rugosa TaxID=74645 RepID=UPI002B405BA0|nr:codeine O-demethylase-like [Rosa rugosa]XP_062010561.1 codeine O-demethylase-like [Rosa rugosa]XP_062010562.1 codeine O-demethylase-like [Rosa rugosa]XP_062010563.1 codeine O-demethylase-like [Rosa rugosa]
MSIKGEEPPPQYIVKESKFGAIESSPELGQIPIIDVSLFSPSSIDSKQAKIELDKLRTALTSSGCFQAIGHGISSSFLDKVRKAATQFFELPVEEKQKYSREIYGGREGYGEDIIVSEKQVLDWSYRLILHVFPEDHRRLDLWPENPNGFGEVVHEYATKVKFMMGVLFKAMAKSLNLEEDSFSDKLLGERALMQARFNFYPPCSRSDQVLGVKPHTDRSGVTVLLQDKEVEGLQVLVDDKWVRVPIVPHAIVVNLGDQMQIMSNGVFKSPMHRVVTNPERMRLSVALFNEPDPETEISPVEKLIDETRPRVYKNVKNYGRINYECYQRGEIALETVKI